MFLEEKELLYQASSSKSAERRGGVDECPGFLTHSFLLAPALLDPAWRGPKRHWIS